MIKFEAPEPIDQDNIETLLDVAFGTDRQNKTSYRYRQNLGPCDYLAMVARDGDHLVGSIQYWQVKIGKSGAQALLLGPLAVCPNRRGEGIGVLLVKFSLARAQHIGYQRVLLVGDAPYYQQFGFAPAAKFKLEMPGEPERLMALPLVVGGFSEVAGLVSHKQS